MTIVLKHHHFVNIIILSIAGYSTPMTLLHSGIFMFYQATSQSVNVSPWMSSTGPKFMFFPLYVSSPSSTTLLWATRALLLVPTSPSISSFASSAVVLSIERLPVLTLSLCGASCGWPWSFTTRGSSGSTRACTGVSRHTGCCISSTTRAPRTSTPLVPPMPVSSEREYVLQICRLC